MTAHRAECFYGIKEGVDPGAAKPKESPKSEEYKQAKASIEEAIKTKETPKLE